MFCAGIAPVPIHRSALQDAPAIAAVYRGAYREHRDLGFPAKAESVTAETVAEWIDHYRVVVARADEDIVEGNRLHETEPDC